MQHTAYTARKTIWTWRRKQRRDRGVDIVVERKGQKSKGTEKKEEETERKEEVEW